MRLAGQTLALQIPAVEDPVEKLDDPGARQDRPAVLRGRTAIGQTSATSLKGDTQAVRTPRVRRAPIRAIVVGNTSTPCSASTSLK